MARVIRDNREMRGETTETGGLLCKRDSSLLTASSDMHERDPDDVIA